MSNRQKQECLFCNIVAGQEKAHEIYRDEHCVAILDIFPLKPAHVLLISRYHAERFEQLPTEQVEHISKVAQRLVKAQSCAGFANEGYNMVINNGKVANQHVPHVHIHLIPRQKGDRIYLLWRYITRFMDSLVMVRKQKSLSKVAQVLRQHIS